MNDVSSISSTSLTSIYSTILIERYVYIVYHCSPILNQHRVNTVCLNHVYIVHIVYIAMLYGIEKISCRHRLPLITMFTLFILLTPQRMYSALIATKKLIFLACYRDCDVRFKCHLKGRLTFTTTTKRLAMKCLNYFVAAVNRTPPSHMEVRWSTH